MRRLIGSALALFLVFCAAGSVNPVSVPLQYKLMAAPAEFPSAITCGAISRVDVTDARTSQVLGTRYLQERTSARADVTSTGDVAAWMRSGAEAAVRQSGVAIKADGPTLRLRLDGIKTDESVYRRAEYTGRVNVSADLVSPNGRSCWRDSVEGVSQNYGYAGSPLNYQETLNHALDRAMIRILGSGEFRKAVCDCS